MVNAASLQTYTLMEGHIFFRRIKESTKTQQKWYSLCVTIRQGWLHFTLRSFAGLCYVSLYNCLLLNLYLCLSPLNMLLPLRSAYQGHLHCLFHTHWQHTQNWNVELRNGKALSTHQHYLLPKSRAQQWQEMGSHYFV